MPLSEHPIYPGTLKKKVNFSFLHTKYAKFSHR